MNTWYCLDPDNRREPKSTTHCERCKRTLSGVGAHIEGGYFRIIVEKKDGYFFRKAGPTERANETTEFEGLIGQHCFNECLKYGEYEFDGKEFIEKKSA